MFGLGAVPGKRKLLLSTPLRYEPSVLLCHQGRDAPFVTRQDNRQAPAPGRGLAWGAGAAGAQLGGGRVHQAESFGELEGALGLGAVGQEAARLPAQRLVIVPMPVLRSALGSERLLSEIDRRAVRHHRADAASAGSMNLEGAPQ
jgi:hypothetical protein